MWEHVPQATAAIGRLVFTRNFELGLADTERLKKYGNNK